VSVSKEAYPTEDSGSVVSPDPPEGVPLDQRVVILTANHGLYQALSSSLAAVENGHCTCRHCPPGSALPDAASDQHSVFLLDCLSLDETTIDQYLEEGGRGGIRNQVIVLFNVAMNWDFRQKNYAQKIRGVFFQDDSKSIFLDGMRNILNGRSWFSQMSAPLDASQDPPAHQLPEQQLQDLSEREMEILRLVSVGMKNTEIAAELAISLNTVKTHIYNSYKKIGVSNRLQAAIWATAQIPPQE